MLSFDTGYSKVNVEYEAYIQSYSYLRESDEVVRPRIPLSACIKNFAKADVVDGFYSTALQRKSVVRK